MPSIRILLFAVVATVLATTSALAQRPDKYTASFPIHVYNPCCEEVIHFDIEIKGTFKHMDDAAGNHHVVWVETIKGSGIGLSSGTEYKLRAAAPETHRLAADGTGSADMFIIRQHVVAADGSCSYMVKLTLKFTVNANGEPTVEIVNQEIECHNGTELN